MDHSQIPIVTAELIKMCPPSLLENVRALDRESWLTAQDQSGEPFSVGCAICMELLIPRDQDVFARFEVRAVEALKPYRIKAHASSQAHQAAVLRMLSHKPGEPVEVGDQLAAPAAEVFSSLLAWIRKGGCLRDGVPNVGHFKKSKMLSWTLAEALRRTYRTWLAASNTVALLRDERHSRLLVRFRCANSQARRFVGVLAQGKLVKNTATNVTNLTKQLLNEFCTTNFGCPYYAKSGHADIASFDSGLFDHIREHIHSVTVDAASDEIAACTNMQHADSSTAVDGAAFCPNILAVIRDKAHCSRRILARPWSCDPYLDLVAGVLVSEKNSLSQMIQYSDDFRAWFFECCRDATTKATTTEFKHLRAAKHRYESLTAPLTRICLNWEAVISFLVKVSLERRSPASQAILDALDAEMMLQAGLLADATDEAQILIRFFDTGDPDSGKISASVATFLQRLHYLFDEQNVWTSAGYTLATLRFLEAPTHIVVRGEVRCIGGPNAVPAQLRSRCLSRMLAWRALAEQVVRAEHPSFELVQCFSAFDMECFEQQAASMTASNLQCSEALRRVASSLQLDLEELISEYLDLGSIALAFWRNQNRERSNLQCWQHAIDSTSSSAARRRHPVNSLAVALAHYGCMTSSDSVVERDFSRVKHVLGEKRLQCAIEAENDIVVIALS
ncbi:unnamed protein product, partial [Effrenium voratum]